MEGLLDCLHRTTKEVRIQVVNHLQDVVADEVNLFPILPCLLEDLYLARPLF